MAPYEAAVRRHSKRQLAARASKRAGRRITTIRPRKHVAKRNHNPYQPLDEDRKEIRLLLVKAGQESEEICCELQQAFLTSDPLPQYETISYSWGTSKATGNIVLNGKRRKVPASSKAAIKRMRLPDTDRVLWIDALCINQADPRERGHQVGLMHKVYSNNQRNLIYLGEGSKTTARAIQTINKILESAEQETNQYRSWHHLLLNEFGRARFSETGIEWEPDFTALDTFFSAPWFSRLWVVQEATLSSINVCYCGSWEILLWKVLRAARWLQYKHMFLPTFITYHRNLWNLAGLHALSDQNLRKLNTIGQNSTTLLSILGYLRDFEVTVPRDRIYAIVGLHEALNKTPILADVMSIDYQKSLQCVLRDAARFAIWEEGDLFAFQHLDIFNSDNAGSEYWPSWAPHWHLKHDSYDVPSTLEAFFNADNGTILDVDSALGNADPDQLTLAGDLVDTVSTVSRVAERNSLNKSGETLLLIQEIRNLLKNNPCSSDFLTIGATLIAGANYEREHASEEDCSAFSTWSAYIENTEKLPPSFAKIEKDRQNYDPNTIRASEYNQNVYEGLGCRRFFVTASGSMGIGPRKMRSQDIITILYGCMWPVVLRRQGEYYNILGTCYVHGIMYGEIVRKHQSEGKKAEVFVIR